MFFFSFYILHLAYSFVMSRKLVFLLMHSVSFLPPYKLKPRSPKSNKTQLNQIWLVFLPQANIYFSYGPQKLSTIGQMNVFSRK